LRKDEYLHLGMQAGNLTDDQRLEALDCIKRLEPYGASIKQAVDLLISNIEAKRKATSIVITSAHERFISYKKALKMHKRTIEALEVELTAFFRGREAEQLSTITQEDCSKWITAPFSAQTQHNRRQRLSAFYNWAINQGYCEVNLASKVECAKIVRTEPVILTNAQARRLINASEAYEDGIMTVYHSLGLFCALRTEAEIERLSWDDIDLEEKTVIVTGTGKGQGRRVVEIPDTAIAWMARHAETRKPIFPANARTHLTAIRKMAGIIPWPSNCMRHTAVSNRYASAPNPDEVSKWAGHMTSTMHKFYRARVTKAAAREFWDILPPDPQLFSPRATPQNGV
jgi:integrase